MLFHSEHRFALIGATVKQNIQIRNKNKCTYNLLKEIKIFMAISEENIQRGTKFLIEEFPKSFFRSISSLLSAFHKIHCQTKLLVLPVPPSAVCSALFHLATIPQSVLFPFPVTVCPFKVFLFLYILCLPKVHTVVSQIIRWFPRFPGAGVHLLYDFIPMGVGWTC